MDPKTIAVYDRIADEYERRTADFWSRTPQPPFIDLFATACGGRRVLDIGCGTGRDGRIFREQGLAPICLDASTAMIKLAAEKGLPTVLGDFARMPFRNAEFDGVWAYTSFLHVPKSEVSGALAEARRVLKPGGVLGLGLYEGDTEEYRDPKGDGHPRWFSYYAAGEIRSLLARNGFRLVHSDRILLSTPAILHFLARKD